MRKGTIASFLILVIAAASFGALFTSASAPGGSGLVQDRALDIDVGEYSTADHFIENLGQLSREDIEFYSIGSMRLGFTTSSVVFALDTGDEGTYSYEMVFVGGNNAPPVPADEHVTYYNYFKGKDSSKWVSGARTYSRVVYNDIYDGIDAVYYFKDGAVKYDIVVSPGADPSAIKLKFVGAQKVSVLPDGSLMVATPFGEVIDGSLEANQGGAQVQVSFAQLGPGLVGFKMGAYDPDGELTIDPLLKYSTYFGGSSEDYPSPEMHPWGDGIVFSGYTYSYNFPISPGVVDSSMSNSEAYVSKLSFDLSTLKFSTFLGGSDNDEGYGFDIDSLGHIYVTGTTYSLDYPTTSGAYNTTSGIWTYIDEWGWPTTYPDGFITKMSPDGKSLIYSSYFGGNTTDNPEAVAVDSSGIAFIGGTTDSQDFPTVGAYSTTFSGYNEMFVIVFNVRGSGLVYSTYLGGSDMWGEYLSDLEIDSQGRAVVTGYTSASDFPVTKGAFNTNYVYDMSFVTRFSADGASLSFSTFIDQETYPYALDIKDDDVYVTGYTYSTNFPLTKDAYDSQLDGYADAFVTILYQDGSRLVYSTLLGGTGWEQGNEIVAEDDGTIEVAGTTDSSDFPVTKDAYGISINGYQDAFITQFTTDWSALNYSSYFGGSDFDSANGILLVGPSELCISGQTASSDMPVTTNPYDKSYNGGWGDHFLCTFKTNSFRPGAPRDPSLIRGNQNLNVTWSPPFFDGNETVTKYSVYQSLNNMSFDKLGDVPSTTNFYVDKGLTNGREYYYYVTAHNIVGEGPPSRVVMGSPATIPSSPRDLALKTGDGFLNLTWNYPNDDGGDPFLMFNVYSGTSEADMTLMTTALDRLFYNRSGLENGRTYYFKVSALNIAGEGTLSGAISGYPSRSPSPPVNLSTVHGDGFILLSWTRPLDDGGDERITYSVFMSSDNDTFQKIGSGMTLMQKNVTGLENGRIRFFRVTATNPKGESAPSVVVFDKAIGKPTAPTDLNAEPRNGKAYLWWDAPMGLGGDDRVTYNVYGGESQYSMELLASGLTVLEYLAEELVNGQIYHFAVSATNSMFEGPRSDGVTVTPLGVPSVPLNLEVEIGDGKIDLGWSPPEDMGGDISVTYEVFFGSAMESMSLESSGPSSRAKFTSLKNGRTYYMKVRAINTMGPGEFSEIINATPMKAPTSPLYLLVTVGNGTLYLSWAAPTDDGGAPWMTYTIYLGNSTRPFSKWEEGIQTTQYTITGLKNGVKYSLAVSAVNPMGESLPSEGIEGTPTTIPQAPRLFLREGDGYINITWLLPEDDGGSPVLSIKIFRGTGIDDIAFVRSVEADKGHYVDADLKNGVTYYYRISCVNGMGEGPSTGVSSAAPKGVKEKGASLGLYIFVSLFILILLAVIVGVVLVLRKRKAGPQLPGPPLPPTTGAFGVPPQAPQPQLYPGQGAPPQLYAPQVQQLPPANAPPPQQYPQMQGQQYYQPPAAPPPVRPPQASLQSQEGQYYQPPVQTAAGPQVFIQQPAASAPPIEQPQAPVGEAPSPYDILLQPPPPSVPAQPAQGEVVEH